MATNVVSEAPTSSPAGGGSKGRGTVENCSDALHLAEGEDSRGRTPVGETSRMVQLGGGGLDSASLSPCSSPRQRTSPPGRTLGACIPRLSSTASSLDADDEADSSSHATTPPTSSTNFSHLGGDVGGRRGPFPLLTKASRKLTDGAAVPSGGGVGSAAAPASSLPSLSQAAAVSAVRKAPLLMGSSGESTASSREASTTALTTTTAAGGRAGGGEKESLILGPSVALGTELDRLVARGLGSISSGVSSPRTPATRLASSSGNAADEGTISSPYLPTKTPVPATVSRGPSVHMEQFGCCVFFFPTPILSWLFPLSGHVAISNAEGTRLYTFESSYFVREERMVDVLDRVVENIHGGGSERRHHRATTPFRLDSRRDESNRTGSSAESDGVAAESPIVSPLPMPASSGGEDEEGGSNSGVDRGRRTRPFRFSSLAAGHNGRSYPGSPIRRQVKQLSSINSGSHSHAGCFRIWDLKPMLMESRGRGEGRPWLPLRLVSKATRSNSAIAAVWQRLQEFIPVEGGDGCSGTATPALPRTSSFGGDHTGSGSETEEERNHLLDFATARFFNRNLQATINIFRGSPEGSRAPLDMIMKSSNSYSFVGFVLETCGLGGGPAIIPTPHKARTAPATAPPPSQEGNAESSRPAPPSPTTPTTDAELVMDGISWGPLKILASVFFLGEWHRSEHRVWRVAHGGTITGACFVWTALLALILSCMFPLASRGWWWWGQAAGAGEVVGAAA